MKKNKSPFPEGELLPPFYINFAAVMQNDLIQKNNRQVARWLLIGVGMIMIQVMLGGITRLTESGLSITEWKPITGALPPLNEASWQAEFDRYKLTDQFKFVHNSFSIKDFKFIFFWEWFHRLWARLMGTVFIIGFIYFLIRQKFNRPMIKPMILLFILGALQGAIGWLMVKSGLVPEKFFVGHVELATHFIAALGLLAYTYWFAMQLLISADKKIISPSLKKQLIFILIVLVIQLIYGAFMAGLKAAQSAPTWPDINGYFIPPAIRELSPLYKNLFNNNLTVQFIHRGLAYLLVLLSGFWWYKAKAIKSSYLFSFLATSLIIVLSAQVVLGISTLLNATYPVRLAWFGVAHQFTGMLFLVVVISLLYIVRKKAD
jgi:heme a synthase